MIRAALALALALLCAPAFAQLHGDYTLEKRSGVTQVISSKYGRWQGSSLLAAPVILGEQQEAGPASMSFEFQATGYFYASNSGHVAVGLQGGAWPEASRSAITGRGVVIGNLSGYPERGRCSAQPPGHRVSIEGFYGTTNCVLGNSTASIPLIDGERYRLTVSVDRRLISYHLEQRVGMRWVRVSDASAYDMEGAETAGSYWWITEVFSPSGWTFRMKDLNYSVGR